MTITILTEEQFDARFPLVKNHLVSNAAFDGCLFETYGQEVAYVANQDPDYVWTVMDGDDGGMFFGNGIHVVNRIGYLISTVPVPPGEHYEVAIPFENDDTVRDTFGMACPSCGSDAHLQLNITVWANLSADGTEPFGDHHWDDASLCRCHACAHSGNVAAFRIPAEVPGHE